MKSLCTENAAPFEFLMRHCSPDLDRTQELFVIVKCDTALNMTILFWNMFKGSPQRLRTNTEFKVTTSEDVLSYILTRLTMHCAAFINYRSERCQQASTCWQKMINTTRKFDWESAWSHLQSATMWNFLLLWRNSSIILYRVARTPLGSWLHHTSQSDSMHVWFGEVEVLELFFKIAITLRHKELCVSQVEVGFW